MKKPGLKGRRLVFDIETNGLHLEDITQLWVMCVRDFDSGKEWTFSDFDKEALPIREGFSLLDKASCVVGHNIVMYDLPALKKLMKWEPRKKTKVIDTMLLSQILCFPTPKTKRNHSLAAYGELLGFPKVEHEEWSKWSREMSNRCRVDVRLNAKVYDYLSKEAQAQGIKTIRKILKMETKIAEFSAEQVVHGWKFDVEACEDLLYDIRSKCVQINNQISPKLPPKITIVDKEPKEPVWTRSGQYHSWIKKAFDLEDGDTQTVEGLFQRFKSEKADLGSTQLVKDMLLQEGWVPDEYNLKKDPATGKPIKDGNGEFVKTSPKLSEESIGRLSSELGHNLATFYTLRSREGVLGGLLKEARANYGRVKCRPRTIGTPTGRMTHKGVVNIPSKGMLGKECRRLFVADQGLKVVGCDSVANQLRALAHYVNNPEFTASLLEGREEDGTDAHSKNCLAINTALEEAGLKGRVTRASSKTCLYAMLFSAGDAKIGSYLSGVPDKRAGQAIRRGLMRNIKGLEELTEKCKEEYHRKRYILAVDGRRVWIDSEHKSLNYLLQSFEAVTVKASVAMAYKEWKKRKLRVYPLLIMHDELQVLCDPSDVSELSELLLTSFKEAPKAFGVQIHEGNVKVGLNWGDSH